MVRDLDKVHDTDSGTADQLPTLMFRFEADEELLLRKYPLRLSAVRADRLHRLYTDWLSSLERLPFALLSRDDRIDFVVFRNHLNRALHELDLAHDRRREMLPLVPFMEDMLALEEQRLAMSWIGGEEAAHRLSTLIVEVAKARARFESEQPIASEGRPARMPTVVNRAAEAARELLKALEHWYCFYNGYDPVFTWWCAKPYEALQEAVQAFAELLVSKLVGGASADVDHIPHRAVDREFGCIVGEPLGTEALLAEIAYEMIPYSPEELIKIAESEHAWCVEEMRRASRDLGYGDDWRAALEYVKSLHQPPGAQPELIRELALEAIEFLDRRDLVTIPELARETWRMEMMAPDQQRINPFFLGGETIRVSFPTDAMSHEQKRMSMRGNNIHFARATVQHELIPGHHLQGFMMDRYNTHRRITNTVFWIEGWALYWEMRLWDLEFARSPEDRIGMLFWRMHRSARIIFSLGFHLKEMSPDECVEFLVQQVGHERANALAEVRRSFGGDYNPLYQCAYLLGGLQIRALHREVVGGRKMTDREFHDAILHQNTLPIEMLRFALRGESPEQDFTPSWRFYDEPSFHPPEA